MDKLDFAVQMELALKEILDGGPFEALELQASLNHLNVLCLALFEIKNDQELPIRIGDEGKFRKIVMGYSQQSPDIRDFHFSLTRYSWNRNGAFNYRFYSRDQLKNLKIENELRRNRISQSLNPKPYGRALAAKVAQNLQRELYHGPHRDYCGTGFAKNSDGTIDYSEFFECEPSTKIKSFSNNEEFVNWLADQSDLTMARLDSRNPFDWHNQTVSRSLFSKYKISE